MTVSEAPESSGQKIFGEPPKSDSYRGRTIAETLFTLETDADRGLAQEEVARRLAHFGYNEIQEREEPLWHRLFRRFWGPIPWMIEAAAILSAMVEKWDDFAIIAVMLLVNAGLDFFQEHRALNALKALKQRLTAESLSGVMGSSGRFRPGNWCPAIFSSCASATSCPQMFSC